MGNITKRLVNHFTRPFREYNLQDRAHKAVIRNRDIASPRHATTDHIIKETLEMLPTEVKEDLAKPDEGLNSMLQKVYVSSHDVTPNQPMTSSNTDRPLPLSRKPSASPEFGYSEPRVIPYGRTTLKTAMQFIAKHQEDPEQHSAEAIALLHELDPTATENVLKHFSTFRLLVPAEPTKKQVEMLKRIDASPSFLLNTPKIQELLSSVAMKAPTPGSDSKIPMTPIQGAKISIRPDHLIDPEKGTVFDPLSGIPEKAEKEADSENVIIKDPGMEIHLNGIQSTGSYVDAAVSVDTPLVNNVSHVKDTAPVDSGDIPVRSATRAKRAESRSESAEKKEADAT